MVIRSFLRMCIMGISHYGKNARVGENPFEGGPNDVPISTISRGIEIDLREMLDENKNDIPGQFPEDQNVQM